MSQLIDPDAARQWLVGAFAEYHDAREIDGASHEQALEATKAAGYHPGGWPGHRMARKRQTGVRQAAVRELRQRYGHLDTGDGRPVGQLLRCLTGLQRADAAAATLFPEETPQ